MYTVVPSPRFRKQSKQLAKSDVKISLKLEATIKQLCLGLRLPDSFRDHKLTGEFQGFRECHIAPDWLLIYRKYEDVLILELVATGSHTNLFD